MLSINWEEINENNADNILNKIIQTNNIEKLNIDTKIPTPILYKNGFLKDEVKMEEAFRNEDRFGFNSEISNLTNQIDNMNNKTILWYIWPFWSGKTTILNQIHKNKEKKVKRIEFLAWKYPNRENLWENFVYEIAKELWVEEAKKVLLQIQRKPHNRIKALLIDIINRIKFLGVGITSFMDFILAHWKNNLDLVYTLLWKLLWKLSKNGNEEIYLIIEDIDRSGDRWIFFLETLQHFLTNECKEDIKIKVIVPLDKQIYYQHSREYLKIINTTYMKSNDINIFHRKRFAKHLFSKEVCNGVTLDLLWKILEYFFTWSVEMEEHTIRSIKHILKQINIAYKTQTKKEDSGQWLDLRLFLISGLNNYYKNCFKFSWMQYSRIIWDTKTIEKHYDLFVDIFEQDLGKEIINKIQWLPYNLCFKSRSSDLIWHKHYIRSKEENIFLINDKYDVFPIQL